MSNFYFYERNTLIPNDFIHLLIEMNLIIFHFLETLYFNDK